MPESGKLHKVLVIDDDAGLLRMVRAQLIVQYEVILAEGGGQALRLIDEGFVPDVILLDVDMPGMDGYETLKKLKDNPHTEDVPVIFLTGLDSEPDQVKGLGAGVEDYITKPFVRDVMLARLKLRLENGMERRMERGARKKQNILELDESRFEELTKTLNTREKETAKLMALGYSNQEIAAKLAYSLNGVKKLTMRVFDKTGFSDRNELKNACIKKH